MLLLMVNQCETEIWFRYREPKPRFKFGIGFGAEFFFSETETFIFIFSHFFPLLGVIQVFYKLENEPRS